MSRSATVEDLRAVQAAVEIVCGELAPDERVREGYDTLVAMERLVTGARMQRRVAEAGAWHGGGDRNAEDFLARTTGSTRALAIVIRDGVDIRNVTHLGRQVTAHQRTALEARGRGASCCRRRREQVGLGAGLPRPPPPRDRPRHRLASHPAHPPGRPRRNPAKEVVAGGRDPTRAA